MFATHVAHAFQRRLSPPDKGRVMGLFTNDIQTMDHLLLHGAEGLFITPKTRS